ncbi:MULTISPECIES: MaoC family dehydratase N-terminal domain-containing protein [Ferrimonas]|uniref:MaoC family dehydratase N-terminal domain-containing protein n=1 Tax=Ferrimonas TaxID=44011 RepID=UPI0004199590|nr:MULTISPECIES: MaoC family dehydratase N-terminal domain-containing protein [Ferrimonas]USD39054.1 MaoC family dehydratase N-terminal domain-containing protein [Ferrimonas sp. SCSIO 43195]
MLDSTHIGHRFAPFRVSLEAGRLAFFSRTIGETNPLYFDLQVAREAGLPGIMMPPTFLFSLDLESPQAWPVLTLLDMDIAKVLHGGQEFDYQKPVYSGDSIEVHSQIENIVARKGGRLELVELQNHYLDRAGETVARAKVTLVYCNE